MKWLYTSITALTNLAFAPCNWTIELYGKPVIRFTNGESEDVGGYYFGESYSFELIGNKVQIEEIRSPEFWQNKNLIFRSDLGETATLIDPKLVSFTNQNRILIGSGRRASGLKLVNSSQTVLIRLVKIIFFFIFCLMVWPIICSISIIRSGSVIMRVLLLFIGLSIITAILLPYFARH